MKTILVLAVAAVIAAAGVAEVASGGAEAPPCTPGSGSGVVTASPDSVAARRARLAVELERPDRNAVEI